MFAGWRGKRKEVQVLQPPTLGPGPGSGLPAFGPVFFQPEIPVEPRSGQGKTKYQPAVRRVVGLIATVCCQVWAWGQPDERHAASPHQQTMQVTSKGRKKKKYSSKGTGRPHNEPKAVSAVCIVFWEIKRSVSSKKKRKKEEDSCVLLCSCFGCQICNSTNSAAEPQTSPFIASPLI